MGWIQWTRDVAAAGTYRQQLLLVQLVLLVQFQRPELFIGPRPYKSGVLVSGESPGHVEAKVSAASFRVDQY